MTRILIAEDDPAIAELLELVLRDRLGVETLVVANGALVTDAIAEHRPELLILDVALPGLSGLDVFALVQGSPASSRVAVLFLTAKPDDVRESAGRSRVMGKPFDVEALVAMVTEMLATARVAA